MTDDTVDPYRVFTTDVIPEVTEVRFYDSTIAHIAEGHPELRTLYPALEFAIGDTISNPSEIRRSNKVAPKPTWLYVSNAHTTGTASMVVVVKNVESSSAVLKTAYFSSEVGGNAHWPRGNTDADDQI